MVVTAPEDSSASQAARHSRRSRGGKVKRHHPKGSGQLWEVAAIGFRTMVTVYFFSSAYYRWDSNSRAIDPAGRLGNGYPSSLLVVAVLSLAKVPTDITLQIAVKILPTYTPNIRRKLAPAVWAPGYPQTLARTPRDCPENKFLRVMENVIASADLTPFLPWCGAMLDFLPLKSMR